MLIGHKKSRYNIYNNLEFLGLNPYELKHFCFGEEGSDDPGGDYDQDINNAVANAVAAAEQASREAAEKASRAQTEALGLGPKDVQDLATSMLEDPMNFGFAQEEDLNLSKKYREPRIIPKKIPYTYELLADPVIDVLPKLKSLIDRDTARELGANLLSMDVEAVKEAKAALDKGTGTKEENEQNQGLLDLIQKQLDTPETNLSQYYKDFAPMNELEKAGLRTFGTGYRGEFEARSPNALLREEYDPETLMASGIGPRSETLALFSQFAKENPAMTAMEALSAFNAVGSFGTLSEADLGMLGYSPNQAVGPQAAFTENAREEGFYQGLGMLGRAALGPTSAIGVISDIALSGTPNTSLFGEVLDGLNTATAGPNGIGIVDEVSSIYDEVTGPVSEAFDTAATDFGNFVDRNVNSIFDFFSPEEEATYNPAIGMADPAFEGSRYATYGLGESPLSSLPSDGVQNYKNALAGLEEAERAEAISGVPADPSMGLADPAFAVQGQLQPGSFFSGMTPEQVESYVNTVSAPESTKRYVQRTPAPVSVNTPVVENTFIPASELTSNFFPETDLPNNSRFAELAQIYGPLRAQQLLGLA